MIKAFFFFFGLWHVYLQSLLKIRCSAQLANGSCKSCPWSVACSCLCVFYKIWKANVKEANKITKGLARRVGRKGSARMQRRVRSCGLALQHQDSSTQGLFILKDGCGTVAGMVQCKREMQQGRSVVGQSRGPQWGGTGCFSSGFKLSRASREPSSVPLSVFPQGCRHLILPWVLSPQHTQSSYCFKRKEKQIAFGCPKKPAR